tara:strand:- start:273 stop:572 length:300 start_codon:yes stop_codon:yes gene_type:complete
MRRFRTVRLPLDSQNVSIELTREIEDEETGEAVAEHTIEVSGRFHPSEPLVGLGPHIEVTSAHRTDTNVRQEVDLDDFEVDSLLDLFREQLRTESGLDV